MYRYCLIVYLISSSLTMLLLNGCSNPSTVPASKSTAKATTPTPIKPKLGDLTMTLPAEWLPLKQEPSNTAKQVESLSFIRKIDQSLWANPGPAGTNDLPVINLTISPRAADAPRDDLNPEKLGNGLVKQGVFTKLIAASEIQFIGLTATKVVGDSPLQGRVIIVLMPRNNYLYKWSLYGAKTNDTTSPQALEAILASIQIQK